MKRLASIILALLTAIMLFSGCAGGGEKRIGEIIDFPDELPLSLTAYSDNPSIGSKETSDAETIKKIVEMYKNRSYVRTDTPAPGGNSVVELTYSDGTKLRLTANAITGKDGKIYAPSSPADGLAAFIEKLIKAS